MAYVSVPKDLTNIKTKFIGNFTKRQCICFGVGVMIGFPTYFLVNKVAGSTGGFFALLAVMFPFFLFGMMEKNGMPLEKYLYFYIMHRFVNPPLRVYKTKTIYTYFEEQAQLEKGEQNGNRKKASGEKADGKKRH